MTRPALGVIADDLTGAADVASLLSGAGIDVAVEFGQAGTVPTTDCDVLIIGLKTRTAPSQEAVARSLGAAARLEEAGARGLYLKYCSTFDSTDAGNIGPVLDALADRSGARTVVVCPAYPAQGRTVQGRLLRVHGVPLAETSMARHPLTPMRDSDVVRLLGRQTRRGVGSIEHEVVAAGSPAIEAALGEHARQGSRYVVTDAVTDVDIASIASASAGHVLASGGAALAAAIAAAVVVRRRAQAVHRAVPDGPVAVLAGSCSDATRAQVAEMARWAPTRPITADELTDPAGAVEAVVGWSLPRVVASPILIHSTTEPEDLVEAQRRFGRDAAAAAVETILSGVAARLVANGVRRLIVAGGDTAGAVVHALAPATYRVAGSIEPGIPWLVRDGGQPLALALKSGNFGRPGLFRTASGRAG